MAKIEVNNSIFEITREDSNLVLDGDIQNYDLISLPDGKFHLVMNQTSYTIEVLDKTTSTGKLSLSINGRTLDTTLNNKLAELLKSMGMETGKKKLKDLKAPMPGLVLDVLVSAGDTVTEGQELLILEAMKMENVIKSPQEGIIDSILIEKLDKVEKNQVLVSFHYIQK
ncbi:acetyl-CoA carboxylase biotin carboxyl carrier protein subunit [Bacteroidia bacterium]|nr:acetyl-CoA carboxylase biotin carboxyl carrier protein subunit [Bacteroidia bacterium]